MSLTAIRRKASAVALIGLLAAFGARADEPAAAAAPTTLVDRVVGHASASVASVQNTLVMALDLIGIRYHRGGTSPETGFDCSGFVNHVFKEGLGLYLPHNAKQISKTGEVVDKTELQPGDLVFFNTMRRAFSHVGIYLGDNKFVHAPRSGGVVRIEDMNESYWKKRFNGARRITVE
ncbi:MAG: C40 family peptidase [Rhodocyclaceae bacterium]|nr:C40 family peptidase [Rhodocyclaceae bacterium]